MLLLDDIAKLWDLRDSRYSVQVVKHKHEAEEGLKFLNKVQTSYKMKNWTSVMIFNNEKCRSLTLDYVNRASGLELHQFHWLKNPEAEIGDIPSEWNYLVGVNPKTGKPKNVHFTLGGPFFNEFRDIEFSSEWFQARECMNSCSQKSESYDRNNKNSGAELNV
nr:hypothetical protein [Pseudobacteriovorax antillogorgiicola]